MVRQTQHNVLIILRCEYNNDMSYTLSTLQTAIKDYLETDETTFNNNLNNFIKNTEEKILKSIQLDVFRKNVTGTGTSGTTYLSTPSDYLASNSLAIIDSDNVYTYLQLKHVSFIRDFTPDSDTTGVPKYYAEFDEDTFILAPKPNSNYSFELHYTARPASLTAGSASGTTWLSTNAPLALLYGSLAEASIFLKNYEGVQFYDKLYQEAMAALKIFEEGKNTRDQYRYDEVRRQPV